MTFFFLGFISSLASGVALLQMAPPNIWGRGLHILSAASQFWVSIIYFLVLAGVILPSEYAKFVYPVAILILSPGWVTWLTHKRWNGSE